MYSFKLDTCASRSSVYEEKGNIYWEMCNQEGLFD